MHAGGFELALHRGEDGGVGRIVMDGLHLLRVVNEVEEVVFLVVREVHELEVLGANAVVCGHLVDGLAVVAIVEMVAPLVVRLTGVFQDGNKGVALHISGDFCPCEVEEGGSVVDVLNEGLAGGARLDDLGPANDEGHFKGFFKHPTLVVPTMFAEVEALVGGVDDDGVFGESAGFELFKDDANAFIHGADGAKVVFDVALILPLVDFLLSKLTCFELFEEGLVLGLIGCVPGLFLFLVHALVFAVREAFGEVFRKEAFAMKLHVVSPIHILFDAHGLLLEGLMAVGVVVEEAVGLGEGDVVEEGEVALSGGPVAVGRFILRHDHEGLFGVF